MQERSRVIINVWLPRLNGHTTTSMTFLSSHYAGNTGANDRIGHVSIQTPNKYASWWPNPKNGEQVGVFNVVGAQNSSFEMDVNSESGQLPDLKVCLYSLDHQAIEEHFNSVEESECGWVLAGDKKITRLVNNEKGQSCCGLAYELLGAGGILSLSSIFKDLKAKWVVVTPENFAEFIKNAKAKELNDYPATKDFNFAGEYLPPPQTSSVCQLL